MSSPLVGLLEALPLELFFALFFARDLELFEAVLLAALPAFEAVFLLLLFALAFAFDPDFAFFGDFDFEPAFDLDLALFDLPAAFLSAI
ncbi:MAG: hypothetical protein ACJ76D_10780 [Solirubrobacterales bacterium]